MAYQLNEYFRCFSFCDWNVVVVISLNRKLDNPRNEFYWNERKKIAQNTAERCQTFRYACYPCEPHENNYKYFLIRFCFSLIPSDPIITLVSLKFEANLCRILYSSQRVNRNVLFFVSTRPPVFLNAIFILFIRNSFTLPLFLDRIELELYWKKNENQQ